MSYQPIQRRGFTRSRNGSASSRNVPAASGRIATLPSGEIQPILQGNRPYWRLRKPDLLALAPRLWDDTAGLQHLLQELRRRRQRQWNMNLRAHIVLRLSALEDHSFRWPTTEAPTVNGSDLHNVVMRPAGLLSARGYRVGRQARLTAKERRQVLYEIYSEPLHGEFDQTYLDEWGSPNGGARLQKLANTIASLTRNAKRRGSGLQLAIQEWESDLAYLKTNYYDGRYDFTWPRVG